MFDALSERLGEVFDRLSGRGVLSAKDVDEAYLNGWDLLPPPDAGAVCNDYVIRL